ncbi:MAG TPA: M13 family metallopeptidase [Caulobacteraceae bacterium]|nr:M13 family metallopeptidase [Caulobacteraceae bacterium]
MLNRRSVLMGGIAASAALSAIGPAAAQPKGKPQMGDFGVETKLFDRAVAPGDDFYEYVNGGWDKANTIPPDKSRFGEFEILRDLSDAHSRELMELAGQAGASANTKKIGDYYAAFMDEAAIEAKGASPLAPDLARIAAISNAAGLAQAIGWLNRDTAATMPINVGIGVDQKDTARYATSMSQGGLGLPDRDYYVIDQAAFVSARAAYKKHVAAMLKLAGFADTDAKAERIYALEDKLARSHWTRIESRDADKTYNPWPTAEIATRAPGFDWIGMLREVGLDQRPVFVVRQPSAFAAFAQLSNQIPLADWKDYLAMRLIASRATVLSKAFVDENFAFNGKVLNGTPEQQVRWKRGVAATNGAMGDAVGRLYAAKYFPPSAKAAAETMIAGVKAAWVNRIKTLKWMTPQTKQKALAKLAALRVEIGYEDKPRDYSTLVVERADAYGNAARSIRHEWSRQMAKLPRPVDRGEWSMIASTVNAQSNFVLVKVMFPAAILQPPFFDPNADPAVNYGGIGAVIGHEMSHQFDDQGSKYDSTGRLQNWWSPTDLAQFKAAGQKLIDQYDSYKPLPDMHIQGGLTLGENIGDLAGLGVAYDAYKASLKGKRAPVIDGFTGEQRFFLGWAQVWRTLTRDPAMRNNLTTDPHSPGPWRAITVRNIDAWYEAFGVKPGQKLYLAPEDRVKVW